VSTSGDVLHITTKSFYFTDDVHDFHIFNRRIEKFRFDYGLYKDNHSYVFSLEVTG